MKEKTISQMDLCRNVVLLLKSHLILDWAKRGWSFTANEWSSCFQQRNYCPVAVSNNQVFLDCLSGCLLSHDKTMRTLALSN